MPEPSFDFAKWRERVLDIRDPKTHGESLEFCRLVESAAGMHDIEVARTLFNTFTDKPDSGVKEAVIRVLASFDLKTYYRAYLEELPRLAPATRKQRWYELLAAYPGTESMGQRECDEILSIVQGMPVENRRAYLNVIRREDFLLHHDWAAYVVPRVRVETRHGEREGDSDAE